MNEIRKEVRINCSSIPRTLLRFFFVSLYPKESLWYNVCSFICVVLILIYPINNYFLITQNIDNFDMVVKTLFHAYGGVIAALKVIYVATNRQRLNNVINKLVEIQHRTNTRMWSQQFVSNVNRVVIVFSIVLSGSIVLFGIATMTERIFVDDPSQWSLPFSDVSFMNRSYFPNYEIAWLYQTVSVFFLAPPFCILDFMIVGLVADLVIQVKLIRERIKSSIEEGIQISKVQKSREASWFYLRNALKVIVDDHSILFDIANNIEEVSNSLMLIEVFGQLGMICFCVYYSSVSKFEFKAAQVYMQLGCISISVFVTSYWGNQLILASQAVGTACYETNFWETDIRFQKGLSFIIMRSQKPMILTVGKFVYLSINIFVWVMKNSYTFFMVLRKSNDEVTSN